MPSQTFSLPSIRELFPDHLAQSPPPTFHPISVHDRRQGDDRPIYHHPPRSLVSAPLPRSTSVVHPHPAPSKRHSPYSTHASLSSSMKSSSPTLSSRPQDSSHYPRLPVDGPPASHLHPMSIHRDSNQQDHQGHPIPQPNPERFPRGQDIIDHHPELQPMSSSDPSQSARVLRHPGVSSGSSPTQLLDELENQTDEESASAGTPSIPKKHVCPICNKAFNRPSSLKIHYNTHTGATPFRCPWPKCGREFNVNSNMRRHLRNHTASTNQETPEEGTRRRRRRSSTSSAHLPVAMTQLSTSGPHGQPTASLPRYPFPRVSESSHRHARYDSYDGYDKDYQRPMDVSDVDEYHASEDPHRSIRVPVPVTRIETTSDSRGTTAPAVRYPYPSQQEYQLHHHSDSLSSSASMRIRALTPGSSFHSSSPSPSPSPSLSPSTSSLSSPRSSAVTSPIHPPATLPPSTIASGQQFQYSPSMPYLRGVRDSHVSTALRPVFSGAPPSRR